MFKDFIPKIINGVFGVDKTKTDQAQNLSEGRILQYPDIEKSVKQKAIYYKISKENLLRFYVKEEIDFLRVNFTEDRKELFSELNSDKYDVVLFPFDLYGEDSLELLKEIKRKKPTMKVFLILNSDMTRAEMVSFLRYKLNAFIVDPVDTDAINSKANSINIDN